MNVTDLFTSAPDPARIIQRQGQPRLPGEGPLLCGGGCGETAGCEIRAVDTSGDPEADVERREDEKPSGPAGAFPESSGVPGGSRPPGGCQSQERLFLGG